MEDQVVQGYTGEEGTDMRSITQATRITFQLRHKRLHTTFGKPAVTGTNV